MGFWKRVKAPKPKYGDFRVMRVETRGGDVTFRVECYYSLDYWPPHTKWQNAYTASYPYFEQAWTSFRTAEAAQAAIDEHVAKRLSEEVVSRTVASPKAPSAEQPA